VVTLEQHNQLAARNSSPDRAHQMLTAPRHAVASAAASVRDPSWLKREMADVGLVMLRPTMTRLGRCKAGRWADVAQHTCEQAKKARRRGGGGIKEESVVGTTACRRGQWMRSKKRRGGRAGSMRVL
jgi:hypothetical protein